MVYVALLQTFFGPSSLKTCKHSFDNRTNNCDNDNGDDRYDDDNYGKIVIVMMIIDMIIIMIVSMINHDHSNHHHDIIIIIIIIMTLTGQVVYHFYSLCHRLVKRSCGKVAVIFKSCAMYQVLITRNISICHMVQRECSAMKLDRFTMAFIFRLCNE